MKAFCIVMVCIIALAAAAMAQELPANPATETTEEQVAEAKPKPGFIRYTVNLYGLGFIPEYSGIWAYPIPSFSVDFNVFFNKNPANPLKIGIGFTQYVVLLGLISGTNLFVNIQNDAIDFYCKLYFPVSIYASVESVYSPGGTQYNFIVVPYFIYVPEVYVGFKVSPKSSLGFCLIWLPEWKEYTFGVPSEAYILGLFYSFR